MTQSSRYEPPATWAETTHCPRCTDTLAWCVCPDRARTRLRALIAEVAPATAPARLRLAQLLTTGRAA